MSTLLYWENQGLAKVLYLASSEVPDRLSGTLSPTLAGASSDASLGRLSGTTSPNDASIFVGGGVSPKKRFSSEGSGSVANRRVSVVTLACSNKKALLGATSNSSEQKATGLLRLFFGCIAWPMLFFYTRRLASVQTGARA